MTMKYKTFTGRTEFKADDDTGYVKAVFATLNCIDHDNDVTLPGAFTEGEPVRIAAWGHNWGTLPPGVGTIHEAGGEAYLEGHFNLKTQAGRDHFETVKQLGDLQEWSYGYDIIDAAPGEMDGQKVQFLRKLKVHEVSPVMLGAGINTHTEMLKEGRRNSGSDLERIQSAHDLFVELGAKCAAPNDDAKTEPKTDAKTGDQSGTAGTATGTAEPYQIVTDVELELSKTEGK